MEADFSGWATRNDIRCADGKTIRHGAFKHQDKVKVPLVWSHQHDDPNNILGHAILEHREEGVYTHGFFNDTPNGRQAKALVHNRNIEALSIYANNLTQRSGNVMHGDIREVSLVLAGANPGALIENVNLMHGEDGTDGEAYIFTGLDLELRHSEPVEEPVVEQPTVVLEHAETQEEPVAEKTIKDVFDTLNEEQTDVVHYLIGEAVANAGGGDDDSDSDAKHSELLGAIAEDVIKHIKEDNEMTHNLFETQSGVVGGAANGKRPALSHSLVQTILSDAESLGSFKKAFAKNQGEILAHSVTNIDLLFPDAKALGREPELLARRAEWVPKVLNSTKHTPFAKVKSLVADLTPAAARAKGYVKGNMKKEEIVGLLTRSTGPATIYKKQGLDRDDILDITDFDIVAWLKWEIRFMLDEEIARAILVGDGRSVGDEDKIKDPVGANEGTGIRSIANDHEMYAHQVQLPTNIADKQIIAEVIRARTAYRGSGSPSFYTTDEVITDLLLLEDKMGRPLYDTVEALAAKLRVKEIIPVEVMNETPDLVGIMVNLTDYSVGTNKGGELSFFDDFDIDFNKYKYLMETRLSGGLTKPKSAIVFRRDEGTAVTPTAPSFDGVTNTITIPTKVGVDYLINGDVVAAGPVVITEDTEVVAKPEADYFIPNGTTDVWTFTYTEV